MKTINPNSLVAIKPAVLSVGGRASPGVYSCPCCAEQSGAEISCAGATDHMGFERLDGDWDVYVDDVHYPSQYDPAATIRINLSNIIEAQNDGFADFWNIDNTAPHHIMFVPKNTEGNPNSYILREENTNQSFAELADGSLVFCLAAAESGDCIPQNLVIPTHTFPLANYLIDYQVNGGAIERWALDLDKFANPDLPSSLLFSMIVFGNPGQAGIQVPDDTFSSGDSLGSFLFDGNTITGTESVEALLGSNPTTIKFFSVIDQPNDPIQTLFGTDEITIHSCGQQNWP
ncbi:MAG: hypothetical protein EOO69_04505 [Moraxellaceae bacterium]|nr:MAG: hypothetical protein EOO69_04505 [Moraxellaceae bacterium]